VGIRTRFLKQGANFHVGRKLQEAHDRMDVAVHYKIPYPRHHHYQGANSKGTVCRGVLGRWYLVSRCPTTSKPVRDRVAVILHLDRAL